MFVAIIVLLIVMQYENTVIMSKHTDIYNKYKAGNFNQTIFLSNTYLGFNKMFDPCQQIDRKKFIKILVDNNIACSGSWCVDNNYKCLKGKTDSCYHCEHIIDKKNSESEYSGYNKDILGNVIMAYGRWNMQIGQLSWRDIKEEKREIYGTKIFNQAEYYVKYCSNKTNNYYYDNYDEDQEYNDYEDYDDYYVVLIDYILAVIIIGTVIVIIVVNL
jgi:hypothetical protein